MKIRFAILLLFICSFCFAGTPFQSVTSGNVIADTPTLKSVVPFPVGAAINIKLLRKHQGYRNTIISQYNSITAENAMKFGKLHPSEDEFRWKDADELVNFAKSNGMRVHGHTLIWSAKNPKWVDAYQGDKKAWKKLLKTHIQTVVKHFKGRVVSWDVVNEAFEDNGKLKKCVWLDNIGPEYLELAFQYAHEADPKALLFFNDYGQEYGGRKMEAILKMVKDFKARNIPIHGLGLQMHVVVRMSDAGLAKGINLAASTGLLVHVSELEISVRYKKPKVFQMDEELANLQAHKYKTIFEAFRAIPKRQQFGITTWNVGDADAFRNGPYKNKNHDHPMLFDIYYRAKPAYYEVLKAMRSR
jgi:endo-1,4-beta-xylanase